MKSALFIGRFQPFHNGHLAVVKEILAHHKHVIIVIGSSENHDKINPLTAGERYTLITAALQEEKISPKKYSIIPVRDLNSPKWYQHLNSYLPPYDTLYTGSKEVKTHFKLAKSKAKIVNLKRFDKISSTKIRKLIATHKSYSHLVPSKVAEILKKWETKFHD